MTRHAAENTAPNGWQRKIRHLVTTGACLSLLAGTLTAAVVTAPAAHAAEQTFTSDDTYTVPAGVTAVKIVAVGGGGGGGIKNAGNAGSGGNGSIVTTVQPVSAGDDLAIIIGNGGQGGKVNAVAIGGIGAANGGNASAGTSLSGGAGGGSTSVTGDDVEIVAGGGGGGGSNQAEFSVTAGFGGNGGSAPSTGAYSAGTVTSDPSGTPYVTRSGEGGSSGGPGTSGSVRLPGTSTATAGGVGVNGAGGIGGYRGNDSVTPSNTILSGGGGGAGYGGGAGGSANNATNGGRSGGGGGGGSKVSTNSLSESYVAASSGAGIGGVASGDTTGNIGANGEVIITALNQATITNATPGNGQATITWTEPSQPSGVDTVTYQVFKDGAAVAGATSSPAVISDLENGETFDFTVVATTEDGLVTTSDKESVTPSAPTPPGAPTDIVAQPLKNSAKLSWTAPASDGGSPITGYKIEAADNNPDFDNWSEVVANTGNTNTSYNAEDLTNGMPYKFRVSAINNIGAGAASTPSNTITPSANTFISTWTTSNTSTGSSLSNQVRLPLVSNGDYDMTIYWGDGTSSNYQCSASCSPQEHTYSTPGTYTMSIQGTFKGFRFNNTGDRSKIQDISNWGSFTFFGDGSYFRGANALTVSASDTPDLSQITSLGEAFRGASSFNSDISNWNTSTIDYMSGMFQDASSFNNGGQPLATTNGGWNTGNVDSMTSMFQNSAFNQNIASWDTANVTFMASMFQGAAAFNNAGQPLSQSSGGWNTSKVTSLSGMFRSSAFNQNIASWDTSKVTNMSTMFQSNSAFSNGGQPLSQSSGGWDTGKVTNMSSMFNGATNFLQDISGWDISSINSSPSASMFGMFTGVTLPVEVYNSILTNFATKNKNSVRFGGGNSKYSPGNPAGARSMLTTAPKSWVITDGGETDTPGATTVINGIPGNGSVSLEWIAADLKTGTGPITGYKIDKATGPDFDTWTDVVADTGNDNVTYVATGLANATEYKFRITAKNNFGWGLPSEPSNIFTPNAIAPQNTTPPEVAGDAVTGSTLTTTDNGTWTGEPAPTFEYQWQTCDIANCENDVTDIPGATSDSYILTSNEIGKWVRVQVKGTNSAGTSYAAATAVGPIMSHQSDQTINFSLPSLASTQSKTLQLTATATSGLPVEYASQTPSVCSVEGQMLVLHNAGTCTVTASQPGDHDWMPAPPVIQSTAVSTVPAVLLPKCLDGSCADADLSGMNLSKLNLSGINFTGANLTSTSLSGSNLTDTRFTRANLSRANLSRSILTRANFSRANLSRANLKNTKAKGSKKPSRRGEVRRYVPPNYSVNLSGANLASANLSNAQLAYANLTKANLRNAILVKAKLPSSNLARANARNANFTKANLRGANLAKTNLKGAKLNGTNLKGSFR